MSAAITIPAQGSTVRRLLSTPVSPLVVVLVAVTLTACGGGGGSASKDPSHPPGSVVEKPDGGFCFADPNQNGNAQEPRVTRQMYGRLVEVFGLDSAGQRVPMASDFVIAQGLDSDGLDYQLEINPVTARENLIVLRDVTDTSKGGGRDQFFARLFAAEQNLTPIHPADAAGAGIYSMVPRNSTVVVQFDDLIDDQTLTQITFRVRTGIPAVAPFEGRVMMDPNHGDLSEHDGVEGVEFYSTRILFDTTVTEIEAFETEPPRPINGVGLPPSVDVNLANFELRIPTKVDLAVGQNVILRNPSGHSLAQTNNGPVDFSSPTVDVVRAARSGGNSDVTADPFNGFLPDDESPIVVGEQDVAITAPPIPIDGELQFVLPLVRFDSEYCAQSPEIGDVLTQPGIFVEVIQPGSPVLAGEVQNMSVRLLLYPTEWDGAGYSGPLEWVTAAVGDAAFLAAFDPVEDAEREACFVRITPKPSGYPEFPAIGLATSSTLGLRFSEPMDPTSLTAFDSLTLTRTPVSPDDDPPLSTSDYVVGSLGLSLDLLEVDFASDLPLAHQVGQTEKYYLRLAPFEAGPTDLAGNSLSIPLPQVELSIDPTAAPQKNGGRVSRFRARDEEPPIGDPETGPLPEWTGQHLYDLPRQLIRPRPATRFLGLADRSQVLVQLMATFGPGVVTPLSNFGSKMQTLWRYVDFGFTLTERSKHNIDVEGLYWAPNGGSVISDQFENFEISLAHAAYFPDEYINPVANLPKYPESGLNLQFAQNFADPSGDPAKVVHPRWRGYQVNPGDLFVAPTGTKLMPFPMNRGVGPDEWTTYTWRDSAVRARGGPNNGGLDPVQLYFATGGVRPSNPYFAPKQIETIGLPLLMEYRCFPDDGAVGQNPFDVALTNTSAIKPPFRAFSTGGISTSGKKRFVDPDLQTKANGGFNPSSTPPGKKTPGQDPVFYIGAADFVARVSRTHSLWFSADDPLSGGQFPHPLYRPPVLEPRIEDQPDGTNVRLAYRGLIEFTPSIDECDGSEVWDPLWSASTLDIYGDHYNDKCQPDPLGQPNHHTNRMNLGMTFLGADDGWHDAVEEINGASYYQVRITFEAEIFTGLVPELSAIALSWSETQ